MKPHDMGTLFDEAAEAGHHTTVHLDRPFDIAPDAGLRHTVADLAGLVGTAAGWLAAAGVRRGDRVALCKDNHWDYDLLACAAIRIGAVPAQLSGHLSPNATGTLLKRLDPALLVTTATRLADARAAGVDLGSLTRRVLTLDDGADGAIRVADVAGGPTPAPVRPRDDDPLVINHTSGTTGPPKLVVHSTRTIIGRLAALESHRLPVVGLRREDIVANASDFAHGRTFCWTAVVASLAPRELVIVSGQDPDLADPVLRAHPPTVFEALPTTFVRWQPLVGRLYNAFHDVRLFVSTYDAVHPPTVRAYLRASARRWPLWMQGWGQTETGPLTFRFFTRRSVAGPNGVRPTARNLGRPIPVRTRLRVVDPVTFRPVPTGSTGLVLVRTAARCLDYAGERDRWQAKQIDGWWNTGDLGARNRDGSVLLLDREVDGIPGQSCLEIEDVLEDRLAEALECVVLGVRGRPALPVVVTAGGTLDPAAWSAAVAGLPPMQAPTVLTWDRVPRTGTGKVRRLALLATLTGATDTYGSGRWT
jgi:acyl-coenzyme A synthetase/AMP-(fatty) acid ligase